jgi:hypothetical protein
MCGRGKTAAGLRCRRTFRGSREASDRSRQTRQRRRNSTTSSWPGLSRPSTSCSAATSKAWISGTRPGMTSCVSRSCGAQTRMFQFQTAWSGRQQSSLRALAKQSIGPEKRMDCFVAVAPVRKRVAFVAGVVPANAGTHKHQRSCCERYLPFAPNEKLWLWVPDRASLVRDDGGDGLLRRYRSSQ